MNLLRAFAGHRVYGRLIALSSLFAATAVSGAPIVSATKSDNVATGSRKVLGATIDYTVTIANTGDADAAGVTLADPTPTNTQLVDGSLRVTPIAVDDAYTALGNTRRVVGAASGLLANDIDPDDAGAVAAGRLVVKTSSVTRVGGTATGGTLVAAADGSFTYTPGVGQTGTERFEYTITDAHGQDSATVGYVEFTMTTRVWYLQNAFVNGDGRSHSPFNSIGSLNTVSAINDTIYILSDTGNAKLNGNIVLKNSQKLFGQGVALAHASVTYFAAGLAPTLTNTTTNGDIVTLASTNTVSGLTFGDTAGYAIAGSSFGTLTADTIAKTGSGRVLNLSTGTLAVAFTNLTTTLTATGGAALNLSSCAGSLTVSAGAITNTHAATRSVQIASSSATVNLACSITDNGGVLLTNNTSGVINFTSGNLVLSTGTNVAFTATGGGTVTVTGSNNTLTTTTATALNVANTTIGSAGLNFKSITASIAGTANGIILDTTGSFGGLTVMGDGSNTTTGGNSSGGTIANRQGGDGSTTTGIGIYLNNTNNVVLRRMTINGTNQNYGIRGNNVTHFTLQYCTVSGTNGTAATLAWPENYGEGSIYFGNASATGLIGTATIANCVIAGGRGRNFSVVNSSGTLNRLAITGTTFNANYNDFSAGSSLAVEARGSAVINSTVTSCTFTAAPGDLANFTGQLGTAMDVVFQSNILSNNHAANLIGGGGLTLATGGTMTLNVSNNTMSNSHGSALTLQLGAPVAGSAVATSLSGTINNNTIGTSGVADSGSKTGNGIFLSFADNTTSPKGQVNLAITNNRVRNYSGNAGIYADHTDGNYDVSLTIVGNTVAEPGASAFAGLALAAGSPGSTDDIDIFAKIQSNDFSGGDPSNTGDIFIGVSTGASSITLAGATPGAFASTTAVQTFLSGQNNFAGTTITAYVDSPATAANFVGSASSPSLPSTLLLGEAVSDAAASSAPPASTFAMTGASQSTPAIARDTRSTVIASTPANAPLTPVDLAPIAAAAIARWEATGLSDEQRARLRALRFEVSDLPDRYLGETRDNLVRVAARPAGGAWFLDATTDHHSASTNAHGVDLLTALMHEIGHILGLADSYDVRDRANLMYGFLSRGERRFPVAGQARGASASDSAAVRHLSAPLSIGTLPAGKSVVVKFSVQITARTNITSQGTVSGSNISSTSTNSVTTEVQQPPAVSTVTKTVNEDATLTFAASDFTSRFSDPNSDSLASVRITSLPTNGTLKLGVDNVAANDVVSAANLASLTYVPAADYHGSDSFNWNAVDSYSTEPLYAMSGAAVNLTVTPVADTPILTATTTPEDTQSSSGLVISRAATDSTEVTHFKITNIVGGTLYKNDGTTQIANNAFITFAEGNAGLKFTPAADKNTLTSDTFSFEVAGATDSSGSGLSATTATASITVTDVNDAPVATADTLSSVAEDSAQAAILFAALLANDTTGPANESGQALTITAVTNAVGGTVSISGTDVLFTPAANFSGTASFDYTLQDNGTTNGAADPKTATGTVSFTVIGANDAPIITAPASIAGSPGDFAVMGISFADTDADSSAVVVTFTASTGTIGATSGGGVTVAGTATARTLTGAIADINAFIAAGNLTFNTSVNTTLSVAIDDQGNTGTGGALSASASVSIVVGQPPVAGFGSALSFERARSEGVQIAPNAALNVGAGSFTVEAWIKRAGSDSGFFTIAGKQAGGGGAGWFFRFNDNILSFAAGANGVDTTATITDADWHHVAAVRDVSANTVAIYIDGQLSKSASFTSAADTDNAAALGFGLKPGYGEYFDGTLDDVRLWSTARTAAQIREFMRTPLAGNETGLLGYWNFEEGTGTTTADRTSNANHGTLQSPGGSTEWVTGGIPLNITLAEDLSALLRLGGSDVDNQASAAAKITALPAHGSLFHTNDGAAVGAEITSVSTALTDSAGNPRRVFYVPAANYNGSDSFSYKVNDGLADSANTVTVNLAVTAVNDAPTLSTVSTLSSATEDTAFTISYATLAAAANEADVDGDTLSFRIEAVSTGTLTKGGSAVVAGTTTLASGEEVVWTPAGNANGTINAFTVVASDGAAVSSSAVQVQVTVAAANDAPTVAANAGATVTEGASVTLTNAMLAAADVEASADSLTFTVSTLPTRGTLRLNGTTLTLNGTFTQANIDSGSVTYTHDGSETTSDSFGFTVSDSIASTSASTFAFTITAVNDTPVITSAATATVAENQTSAYTVTSSDAEGTTLTYAISGGVDAALFEIASATGVVTFKTAPNFEAPADAGGNNVYDVTVTGSDGTATSAALAVAITVTNVNEAPTITSAAAASVAENQTSAYAVTATDADAGATLTYAIGGGADAPLFEIASATGIVTFKTAPNFESPADAGGNNIYDITVTASDGALTSTALAVAITVTNANEAPTITSGATASVAENQTAAAYTVTATDVDAGTTLIYAISGGADAALFDIASATGVVTFKKAPNFESPADAGGNNIYDITVTASDSTATSAAFAVAITVTNVNEAPTITSAATASMAENQTSAYTVTATDADATTTLTYAISGGADAALFEIASATGVVTFKTAPNFESPTDAGTNNAYEITVTASDGTFTSTALAVAITVTNANEAPTIASAATASVAENQTSAYTVTATDADANTTLTYAISGGTDAALFDIAGTSGVVTFKTAPDFESPTDAGSNNVYDITVTASDGALTSTAVAVAITVTNVNEAPVIATSTGATAFTEGADAVSAAVAIDAALTVSDGDSPTLASAAIAITAGHAPTEDVLAFANDTATMGNITAVYDATAGILSLGSTGATATPAQWQAALRAVTYTNTSDAPSTATRTLSFIVNDGALNSTAATKQVSIATANDRPIATTGGGVTSFTESATATSTAIAIDSAFTLADADSATLASATITISAGFQPAQDVLGFAADSATMGNIAAGTYDAQLGTLTLTSSGAAATLAQWQAALRAVTYNNISDTPSTATRTVSFVVNDGATNSAAVTQSITVTATNDEPTEIALDTTAINQSAGANGVVGTLTTTDRDNTTFTYALVSGSGDAHNAAFNISGNQLRATDATALAAGTYRVRIETNDGSGGIFAKAFGLTVVDDIAPAAPSTPDLIATSDTGSSDSDNVTKTAVPTFTGTAEAGSTVTLYADGTSIGTGVASGGTWTITAISALAEGSRNITARATDAANNTGNASAALSVMIDTTAPVITSAMAASATYRSAFAYTIAASGAPVSFAAPALTAGLTLNTATGVISGAPTQSGPVSLTLNATDLAGNTGTATLALTIGKVGLTVSGITANHRVYDGTLNATLVGAPGSLVGVLSGDDVSLTGTAVGVFSTKDVGTAKAVLISGLALGGQHAAHYTLTQPTTFANITAAALSVSGVVVSNKVYDGNTTATLNVAGASLAGVIGSDVVTLDGSAATGAFGDRHVGDNKLITISGFAIGSAGATNYTLTQPTATANIMPKPLIVVGITAADKVYNANTGASLNTTGASLVGVIGTDDVQLNATAATGAFADKSVGALKPIAITGLTLTGNDRGNYSLTAPSATAAITRATLTATGVTAANKAYDGTVTATLVLTNAALSGVLGTDNVSLATIAAAGTFADANVGTAKFVTVTGLSLASGSGDAGNYDLIQPTTTADITPATATIVLGSLAHTYDRTPKAATATTTPASFAVTFAYNGTPLAFTGTDLSAFAGAVGKSIVVSVTGAGDGPLGGTGPYTLASHLGTAAVHAGVVTVGQTKLVAVNILAGGLFSFGAAVTDPYLTTAPIGAGSHSVVATIVDQNYVGSANDTLIIAQAPLTVAGITANDKVYDGTRTASLNVNAASLVGVFNGDTVNLEVGSIAGLFIDKTVAANKPVAISGLALSSADAANYTLAQPTTTAAITAKDLTIAGVTAPDRGYDGTLIAALNTADAAIVGLVAGDDVTLVKDNATGSFADKLVGTAKPLTIAGLTLGGNDAANYTLTQPSATATITARELTITGLTVNPRAFDGTTTVSLNFANAALVGVIANDVVSLTTATAAATLADSAAGTARPVTLNGLALTGADASNYTLTLPTLTTDISRASATVAIGNTSQVYNGSPLRVTVMTTPANLSVRVSYSSGNAPAKAGSYSVSATIDDPNWSGSADAMLTIAKATQTLTFSLPATATIGSPVALSASASSGLPVSFSIVSGAGTLAGSSLTLTAAGSVVVRATQAGDDNFTAASAERTISANEKLPQTITFDPVASYRIGDPAISLNATASSGLPVTLTVVNGPGILSGTSLTFTGAAGALVIRASQPGDAVYAAAPDVTRTIQISAAGPQVFFGSTSNQDEIAATVDANNRGGTIIGFLRGTNEGFVVTFTLNADGTFEATVTTIAASATVTDRNRAAAPATRTFRGRLSNGMLTGAIVELGLQFSAAIQPSTGPSAAVAGFYDAASTNTATGATYSVVGTQGNVYVLAVTPNVVAAGAGVMATDNTFNIAATDASMAGARILGAIDQPTTTVSGSIELPGMPPENFSGTNVAILRTDRLVNLSSRARIGPAASRTLITGFVIGGADAKRVILRAIGPALTRFGVSGTIGNPRLAIYNSAGQIVLANDDWSGSDTAAGFDQVGAFALPNGSRDAAILTTLAPGAYTMHVIDGGETGVALAEIYDASANPQGEYQRLVNISSRGTVESGDGALIGGFVITGNAPKRVLVRGVGPALASFGVDGALADPRLAIYSGSTIIVQNDDWGTPTAIGATQVAATPAEIVQAARDTGAFAYDNGTKDAAVVVTLAPGAYTAQVTSANGTTGVALVEIYEIPE